MDQTLRRLTHWYGNVRALRCWMRWLLTVYWVCLTYLLLAPDPFWFWPQATNQGTSEILNFPDLTQHFMAFGLLGVLSAMSSEQGQFFSLQIIAAVFYSILTEAAQYWIPLRFASLPDLTVNLIGLIAGWMFVVATHDTFLQMTSHSRTAVDT